MSPRTRTAAFSLVELVLVMAIVGITAAIAAPRYARSIAAYSAQAAADRLRADLETARERAKAASSSYSVLFPVGQSAYDIYPTAAPADLSRRSTVRLDADPYRASITSVNFEGFNVLTFSGFGLPDHGGAVAVTRGVATYTLTVQSGTGAISVARTN